MGTIVLVRHGRASFGTDDYDRLSEVGQAQAASLGASWEAGGVAFTSAVAGSLHRHAQTAITALDASEAADGYDVDPGWDEFDHLSLAVQAGADFSADPKRFQTVLNQALAAWRTGATLGGGVESYEGFLTRVRRAFDDVVKRAAPGEHIVVFTSGGPIAVVVSWLLTHDDTLFQPLNDVVLNASTTTILVGANGPRLLAFNEHTHLPVDLVTYR